MSPQMPIGFPPIRGDYISQPLIVSKKSRSTEQRYRFAVDDYLASVYRNRRVSVNKMATHRDRRTSLSAEIAGIASYDLKILNPGSIQINVENAFIVDEDLVDGRHTPPDTRDIALPHHTDEVLHIAVDVSSSCDRLGSRRLGHSDNRSEAR
jgi:hypothetical protein